MIKKITALFLTVLTFLSCTPVVYPETADVDISLSFETENPEDTFDSFSGSYDYVKGSSETDQGFCLAAYGGNSARKRLGADVSDDIVKISFDYKPEGYNTQFYIRLFSPGDAKVAESFCDKGGIFSYYPESKGWEIGDKRAGYEPGIWYQISYYVDLGKKVIYYYCNDKLYGFTRLRSDFDKLSAVQVANDNSYCAANLDNFCIKQLHAGDEELPEAVQERVYLEINSDAHGRIFFYPENIPLKLTIGNKENQTGEYTLKYRVLENGRIVNEQKEGISLEPGEKQDREIVVKTDGYGYYTLTAEIYDSVGTKMGEAISYRFSVANAIAEGEKNERLGIQLQSSGYPFNKVDTLSDARLMRRIGFSYTRGGIANWERYESKRGVYDYDQWLKKGNEEQLSSGLELLPIMAFGNFRLGDEWLTPKTPETIEGYVQYVVHLLRDYQAAHNQLPPYIDIWNEYWAEGSGFNPGYGKAEHYAEMLKQTYLAVKKEFPEMKVCGLSGFSPSNIKWVEDVLAAGAADYMDVITAHPYYNKELPDECGMIRDLQYVKDLFAQYGRSDLPIWLTEWGWPSVGESGYPDERQTASNFVRGHTILDETGLIDRYCWYSSNNVGNDNGQESRFGLLRGHYDQIADEAKPTFLEAANYIRLMTGAEFIKSYQLENNVRAFRYKLADGQDALVCWAVKAPECAGLKLSASAVTLIDQYGNSEIVHGVDGTFSFAFDIDPVYIVGNFSDCVPTKSLITLDKQDFGVVQGDKTEIIIEKRIPSDAEVQLRLPDNMEIIGDNKFSENQSKTILSTNDTDRTEERVPVSVVQNGKKIFCASLNITYQEPISLSVTARPYSAKQLDRWQIVLKVDANYYDRKAGGKFEVISPPELAEQNRNVQIAPIQGGSSRQIKLNIPKSMNNDKIHLKGILKMDGYQPIEVEEMITLRCSVFAKKPPVIDGVIEKDEWNLQSVMNMNDPKQYVKLGSKTVYGGLEDLSAKVYTAWDYENFYFAAEVTDDSWNEMEGTDLLWASDGIQFGIAPTKSTVQLTQVDIGKLHDQFQVLVEIAANQANQGLVEDAELEIKRNGNVTTYELRMPWKKIFFDGFTVRKNTKIAFSMLINDNDGQGRKGYMENGSGLGSGIKNVGEFLDLFMVF